MSTLLALGMITVACYILMRVFKPRYGAIRGCSGRALEEAMAMERRQTESAPDLKKADKPEA
ncbi:MAG: hypothetical protein FWG17_00565 [Desulfovibrionaceae bacterium]|nr:hypothetical protein [Desulfovibrionaceae bacterium]